MVSVRTIEEIVEPAVKALGFELYACELSLGSGRHGVLRVLVDGVNLDDCALISRQVSTALDVADPIGGRYNLEVSSPGLDRPLIKPVHYEKALGKKAKLRTRVAQPLYDNQRTFIGKIVKFDGDVVALQQDDQSELLLKFDDIEKARLLIEI